MKTLVIVDGMWYLFRMFYQAENISRDSQQLTVTIDGEQIPTGMLFLAIKGVLSIPKNLRFKDKSLEIVFAWDRGSSGRKEMMPSYKKSRPKRLDDIKVQHSLFVQMLGYIGVKSASAEGKEADDVIATIAKKTYEESPDTEVIIHSTDRDYQQLLKYPNIVLWRPKVFKTPEKFISKDDFIKEHEIDPEVWLVYRSFLGDSSDEIPGIKFSRKKIGLKAPKLKELCKKYKTLDELYQNLEKEDLSIEQRSSIIDFKKQVELNYKVSKAQDMLDIDWYINTKDMEKFKQACKMLEFNSIVEKL